MVEAPTGILLESLIGASEVAVGAGIMKVINLLDIKTLLIAIAILIVAIRITFKEIVITMEVIDEARFIEEMEVETATIKVDIGGVEVEVKTKIKIIVTVIQKIPKNSTTLMVIAGPPTISAL